ncbi:hypothetical protein [Sulfuricurvum sp.]|uniref:hypothetical protein n=1 Tax=Sulfuricurvum sp. TaxID=2025608 RepID=UPI00260D2070|nr:hypothetical protein [Sulfuricurvum sp.]MDD4883525.1 hypothetical protein [Sulfuricurvum sp.]
MKKLYTILFGLLSFCMLTATANADVPSSNTDKELTWVDEQIQAILPSRIGIPEGFINSLKDPMKMKASLPSGITGSRLLPPPKLGSNLPVIEEPLRLQAIINKSVLINGKWYKLNDSVRNYTLSEIKNNSVLLMGKKEQKLILFLTKQNTNIKITTK